MQNLVICFLTLFPVVFLCTVPGMGAATKPHFSQWLSTSHIPQSSIQGPLDFSWHWTHFYLYIKAHFCSSNSFYKEPEVSSAAEPSMMVEPQYQNLYANTGLQKSLLSLGVCRYIRNDTFFLPCWWEKIGISHYRLLPYFPLPLNSCTTTYQRAVSAHLSRILPKHRAFITRQDYGLPGCKRLHFKRKPKKTNIKKDNSIQTGQLQRIWIS